MDSILRAAGMYLALMLLIIGEATQRALLGLGTVDDVTLVQARDSASQARKLVKGGADPVMLRKQLTNPRDQEAVPPCKVFSEVAKDYIEAHRAGWKSAKHAQQWTNTLTTYAFPIIGNGAGNETHIGPPVR